MKDVSIAALNHASGALPIFVGLPSLTESHYSMPNSGQRSKVCEASDTASSTLQSSHLEQDLSRSHALSMPLHHPAAIPPSLVSDPRGSGIGPGAPRCSADGIARDLLALGVRDTVLVVNLPASFSGCKRARDLGVWTGDLAHQAKKTAELERADGHQRGSCSARLRIYCCRCCTFGQPKQDLFPGGFVCL